MRPIKRRVYLRRGSRADVWSVGAVGALEREGVRVRALNDQDDTFAAADFAWDHGLSDIDRTGGAPGAAPGCLARQAQEDCRVEYAVVLAARAAAGGHPGCERKSTGHQCAGEKGVRKPAFYRSALS